MSEVDEALSREDTDHLRLLAVGHYVVAALQACVGFFPVIHLAIGAWLLMNPTRSKGPDPFPVEWVGVFFVGFSLIWMLVNWSMATLLVLAGRRLKQRRGRSFCLGVAVATTLLTMPFGTVLGILTVIVLMRPSVVAAFEGRRPAAGPGPGRALL